MDVTFQKAPFWRLHFVIEKLRIDVHEFENWKLASEWLILR
jgi:hypothetical protein